MGTTTMRGQTDRALRAIERIGESKYQAKREQGWKPGQPVRGLFSFGTRNTVFDRAMTLVHWLEVHYPDIRLYRDVDAEIVTELLAEKAEACSPTTVRTLVADLRKLQEGLFALGWAREPIVPADWRVDGGRLPRGPYAPNEAQAIQACVQARHSDYGQALGFVLASGARIDEVFHLRADKVSVGEKRVELLGKGGRTRRIQVLHRQALQELDLSQRNVFLTEQSQGTWKAGLEAAVRRACDAFGILRRGVHGLRASAACEFLRVKTDVLGADEGQARRELAQWLGHNPHRTEVTYAYVPRRPG